MRELYRYIWRTSGPQQVLLAVLAVLLFMLELVPLELQRRIVNAAVEHRDFSLIRTLCLVYVAAVLVHGGLKLTMNVYRVSVGETANRRLRNAVSPAAAALGRNGRGSNGEGVAISIIVSEVEAVGGFIASSVSVPLLSAGILLSVFGYMLFSQPWLAVAAILLFAPQVFFIPLLQAAINRRTKTRIKTLRALSVGIVRQVADPDEILREATFRRRVARVYRLNMEIFRRKFGMNFLMNLFYHLDVIGILAIGAWMVVHDQTEVGTIIAFTSGLSRLNDPWGDLVDFFRELTNASVKFQLIASTLRTPAA